MRFGSALIRNVRTDQPRTCDLASARSLGPLMTRFRRIATACLISVTGPSVMPVMAVTAGCDLETPSVDMAYERIEGREAVRISGVPDDVQAMVSVAGADPVALADDGLVPLADGLSGKVLVVVMWSTGTVVRRNAKIGREIDLDRARAR